MRTASRAERYTTISPQRRYNLAGSAYKWAAADLIRWPQEWVEYCRHASNHFKSKKKYPDLVRPHSAFGLHLGRRQAWIGMKTKDGSFPVQDVGSQLVRLSDEQEVLDKQYGTRTAPRTTERERKQSGRQTAMVAKRVPSTDHADAQPPKKAKAPSTTVLHVRRSNRGKSNETVSLTTITTGIASVRADELAAALGPLMDALARADGLRVPTGSLMKDEDRAARANAQVDLLKQLNALREHDVDGTVATLHELAKALGVQHELRRLYTVPVEITCHQLLDVALRAGNLSDNNLKSVIYYKEPTRRHRPAFHA